MGKHESVIESGGNCAKDETGGCAFDRLTGADIRRELVLSKKFSAIVGGHITEPNENQEKKQKPGTVGKGMNFRYEARKDHQVDQTENASFRIQKFGENQI